MSETPRPSHASKATLRISCPLIPGWNTRGCRAGGSSGGCGGCGATAAAGTGGGTVGICCTLLIEFFSPLPAFFSSQIRPETPRLHGQDGFPDKLTFRGGEISLVACF